MTSAAPPAPAARAALRRPGRSRAAGFRPPDAGRMDQDPLGALDDLDAAAVRGADRRVHGLFTLLTVSSGTRATPRGARRSWRPGGFDPRRGARARPAHHLRARRPGHHQRILHRGHPRLAAGRAPAAAHAGRQGVVFALLVLSSEISYSRPSSSARRSCTARRPCRSATRECRARSSARVVPDRAGPVRAGDRRGHPAYGGRHHRLIALCWCWPRWPADSRELVARTSTPTCPRQAG